MPPERRWHVLIRLAWDLAGICNDWTERLIAEAEDTAGAITNPFVQARELGELVKDLAAAGDWDRAEHAASAIAMPENRAGALEELANQLAQIEDWDRAEHAACAITVPQKKAETLVNLVDS